MLDRFRKNLYSVHTIPPSPPLIRGVGGISSNLKPSQQGFTMLEVLVAIFTITFFLAGTFQLIAVEAYFKFKAESEAQANFWVQEDIESIKAIASTIDETSDSDDECDPNDGKSDGYGKTLENQLTTSSHPNYLDNPVTRNLFPGVINKKFTLTRTYNVPADKPHTLEVGYTVSSFEVVNGKAQPGSTIVNRYNLVIIDAALECKVN